MPTLLMMAVFMLYPMIDTVVISFYKWDGIGTSRDFIGLENYNRLFSDPIIWVALKNNFLLYLAGALPQIVLGFLFASLLESPLMRFRKVFQTAIFLPVTLPQVGVAMIWGMYIYHPLGLLNQSLEGLGLGYLTHQWLGSPDFVMPAIIVTAIWMYTGFLMVIFMAGMEGVPLSLYEAARIDGANAWQRLLHITIPSLREVMIIALVLTFMGTFKSFDLIFAMTTGGPGHTSDVVGTYMWIETFKNTHYGYGAATATLTMAVTLAFGLYLMKKMSGKQ